MTKKPRIKKMCWVRATGGGAEDDLVEVYVYPGKPRRDEGDPVLDVRVRPVRLGPGAYTYVVSRDTLKACPRR